MDPLSLTANIVSLTSACLRSAKAFNDLREHFKHAQATLSALCAESTVICASLSQIQSLVLRRPEILRTQLNERSELVAIFDVAITGCMVIYAVLDDEIQALTVSAGSGDGAEAGWAAKAKLLWKEGLMRDLLDQLRGQQHAIGLLIQALQMYVNAQCSSNHRRDVMSEGVMLTGFAESPSPTFISL